MKKISVLTVAALIHSSPLCAAQLSNGMIVMNDVKHDTSLPLRDMPGVSKNLLKQSKELPTHASLVPLTAFTGIGKGLGSYTPTKAIPNVAGSVGRTQYVQWVDPDIGVFDKTTGSILPGFPKSGNALWAGFGGPCETSNSGTPSVKYDALAQRWITSREAFDDANTGPFYVCVAVSTSEDATGSWYRYAFSMDSLSRYGAIAVWSDAYYLSLSMYGPASQGPRVCALEKAKMLDGSLAAIQCEQLPASTRILRPANHSGGPNPVGYPGYFFGLSAPDNLLIYRFSVDWANPANSSLSSPISIPVNNFSEPCPATDGDACVVQPGTSNRLDIEGETFPSRINFRQFPDHSSFVLTHTIQGPPPKYSPAVRWYELRIANNPAENPVVFQQQTFAPDSKARFVGSIAIDKSQNIALGYTVSSSAVHPSPEMGYRNYFDLVNNLTLQPLVTGLGSQIDETVWTTHAAMSIDPSDDCSFWFTSEYLGETGSFNWRTAIVKFKLAACT